MLLFISEDWEVMFAGRQYPFFSRPALDIIIKNFQPVFGSHWTGWHDDQISTYDYKEQDPTVGDHLTAKYVVIDGTFYPLNNIIQDGEKSLHFNDLLRSSCYQPYYIWKRFRLSIKDFPVVHIGGEVPCLRCGKDHVVTPDTMMCVECELEYGDVENDMFGRCDCCDRRMLMNRSYYVSTHSQVICEWCRDNYTTQCSECLDNFYSEDIIYDKKQHTYRCRYCAQPSHNTPFWGF
jgi:hypothetical protein